MVESPAKSIITRRVGEGGGGEGEPTSKGGEEDSNSQSTRGEMTAYALRVRADESLLYRARFEHTALYSHIYIYICIYLASRRDELPAPRSPNSMSEGFNSRLSCS